MQRTDTRKLTVYNNIWEYKIGRNTIAIYDPEGNRYFPKFTDIFEEDLVKTKNFQLNPAVILNFIQQNILAKKWEKVKMNQCNICKERKPDVILQADPYSCEIEGDCSEHFLCDECVSFRNDEI